jgi:hypothetical protein
MTGINVSGNIEQVPLFFDRNVDDTGDSVDHATRCKRQKSAKRQSCDDHPSYGGR